MALALSATVFTLAFAQTIPTTPQSPTYITTAADILTKLDTILNWIFTIALILAVVFLILAGIQFVTSGSDPAKISEARQKLIWAIVGIIVAAIAKGLPWVILNIVGKGT